MKRALVRIALVGFACTVTAGALAGTGRLIVFENTAVRATTRPSATASGSTTQPTNAATEAPRVGEPPEVVAPNETTPEPTPVARPTPAAPAFSTTAFRFSGRSYLGVTADDDVPTFVAPFAGTVEIRLHQFIDGEVRVGSNVPALPFFPYIAVVSGDRRIIYRPGALGAATELLAKDGEVVTTGHPLFRLIAPGRSSWATFYDARAPHQVVVSLQSVPAGRDMDPAIYFGTN